MTILRILASFYNNRRRSWDNISIDDINSIDDVDALTIFINNPAERDLALNELKATATALGFAGEPYVSSDGRFARVSKLAQSGFTSNALLAKLTPAKS